MPTRHNLIAADRDRRKLNLYNEIQVGVVPESNIPVG